MRRGLHRARHWALLCAALAALLAAAACGGSSQTASSAVGEVAGLVPADAAVVLALQTDPESEQWERAEALLNHFPGRERLYEEVQDGLAEDNLSFREDVLPALGDETYLVFLDFENGGDNLVALTQPRDRAKLDALLEKSDDPTVTRQLEGWTLIAENDATLDRFAQAGEKLEDADWFADAQERVEEGALVTFFANGAAIDSASRASLPAGCELPGGDDVKMRFFAGAVTAEDDGVRMSGAVVSDGIEDVELGEPLLDRVPAQAFAFLGSRGLPLGQFGFAEQLRCIGGADVESAERMLGVSFDQILDLLSGGFAFYVRSAPVIPEVTLVLAPEDEAKAVETLDALAERLAPFTGGSVQSRTVDGVEAKEVRAGPVTVLYGAGDGHVVITTTRAGFEALTGVDSSLADDDRFKAAVDAAGVDDVEDVAAYVDLTAIVDLVRTLGGFAQGSIPADVQANLEPLRSLVAWGELDDPNDAEFGFFLQIG